MRKLAELMTVASPLWEGENGGAGGGAGGGASETTQPPATTPPAEPAPAAQTTPPAEPAAAPTSAAPTSETIPIKEHEKQIAWRDKRLAQVTAQLRAVQPTVQQPTPPQAPIPDPVADFNRRVAEAAAQQAQIIAAQKQLDDACNAAVEAGRTEFGKEKFDLAIGTLRTLVTPNDPASAQAYFNLVQSALDAGEAPRILFDLGNDPDEAMRLMTLSPRKMLVEMTRKATKPGPEPAPSLPEPINPVGGRGGRHEAIDPTDPTKADNLSTADWMKRRNDQIAAANGARR